MKSNKTGILVGILVLIIIILLSIIVYAFIIQPAIIDYQIQNQNQGVNIAIATIVNQIQQNGYVQIPVGNQTLILVPLQVQQAQQIQQAETVNSTS